MRRHGWFMRPQLHRHFDGGWCAFGPIQANWGWGNGAMPRGFRLHLTWPSTRSLYLG